MANTTLIWFVYMMRSGFVHVQNWRALTHLSDVYDIDGLDPEFKLLVSWLRKYC